MRLLQFKDDTPCAEGFKNGGPKTSERACTAAKLREMEKPYPDPPERVRCGRIEG